MQRYQGYLRSILQWDELEQLWQQLQQRSDLSWYVYAPGEPVPTVPTDHARFSHFLKELQQLLRMDHDYDYCGIVYVDNIESPEFIKVYDPNNLGSSCGSGSHPPPLPGWVISQLKPCDLQATLPPTNSRQRWWQRVFGS